MKNKQPSTTKYTNPAAACQNDQRAFSFARRVFGIEMHVLQETVYTHTACRRSGENMLYKMLYHEHSSTACTAEHAVQWHPRALDACASSSSVSVTLQASFILDSCPLAPGLDVTAKKRLEPQVLYNEHCLLHWIQSCPFCLCLLLIPLSSVCHDSWP